MFVPTRDEYESMAQLIRTLSVGQIQVLGITVLGLGPIHERADPHEQGINRPQLAWVNEFIKEIRRSFAVQVSFIDFLSEAEDVEYMKQHYPTLRQARTHEVNLVAHGADGHNARDHVEAVQEAVIVPNQGVRIFIDLNFSHDGRAAILSQLFNTPGTRMDHIIFISPMSKFPNYLNPAGNASGTHRTVGGLHVVHYGNWTPAHQNVQD